MSSQSEFEIIFSFIGTDKKIIGQIVRLQSPLIVQGLLDKAPFSCRSRGNIGNPKSYWIFLVEAKKGPEKQSYREIKVGDIVYSPPQDSIFIIYEKPCAPITGNVFYLGKVTSGLENLKTMRNGITCRIEFKEIPVSSP